jgi:hypothetical protein
MLGRSPPPPECQALTQSPLLALWAEFLNWITASGCQLLELDCQTPQKPAEQCSVAWWVTTLAAALLIAALLVGSVVTRLLHWISQRDGSRMIVVAAQVLRELRQAVPAEYPSQHHQFTSPPPATVASDPLAPLLCAVCHKSITSVGPASASLKACAACGMLTHDSCARRAGKTCRPLCCAADHQPHSWQAHGTVLEPEVKLLLFVSCCWCAAGPVAVCLG